MTYDGAVAEITTKLNSIDGLPDVSDAPLHPDSATTPALYFYDDEEILDSADLQRSHTTAATAKPTIMLKTGKVGSANAAKVCRQKVEAIIAAMHALSGTQPGFTVFVSQVKYSYDLANATWATAFIQLTMEAYRA